MGKKKLILLVEDEVELTELLANRFKANGYVTEIALDGIEALEKLETISPDLIVLDVNMPRMAGAEFYAKICDDQGNPQYPIFFLTARADLEKLFTEFKIAGFMAKPFDSNELMKAIDSIMESQSKQNDGNGSLN